jgi:N-methylhydantoinase A
VAGFAAEGERTLEEQELGLEEIDVRSVVELQYEGQTHTVPVPFAASETWDVLLERFSRAHEEAYGTVLDDIPHKVVNVRVAVVGVRAPIDVGLAAAAAGGNGRGDARISERDVLFDGEWVTTPIYTRERLHPGAAFEGPAIVEQEDCTTVVDPGCAVRVDDQGNLVITLEEVSR